MATEGQVLFHERSTGWFLGVWWSHHVNSAVQSALIRRRQAQRYPLSVMELQYTRHSGQNPFTTKSLGPVVPSLVSPPPSSHVKHWLFPPAVFSRSTFWWRSRRVGRTTKVWPGVGGLEGWRGPRRWRLVMGGSALWYSTPFPFLGPVADWWKLD